MKNYIEYRVYIKDSDNRDLLLKVADELHDVIHDFIGDSVISYGRDFTDVSTVLESGDTTYEMHLDDGEVEPSQDTGRYESGHRVFRDGSYREDFGSDR
jgi:hypothetical protein